MTGNEMRERRRQCGLTQIEVADQMGVHKQTVNRWEKGRSKIPGRKEMEFTFLVTDDRLINDIKMKRPFTVRGRPFTKQ